MSLDFSVSSMWLSILLVHSGSVQLGCPEMSTNLQGTGRKLHYNVYRWEDCSRLCRQRLGCRYWAYVGYALLCETMTDARMKIYDPNYISGDRNCGADTSFPEGPQLQCPSRDLQLSGKIEHVDIANVNSWEECARKCMRNEQMEHEKVCNFWEWNENATNCAVMVNNAVIHKHIGSKISGLIAGDRMCGNCRCRSSTKPNCNEDTGDCFYCEEDSECMNQSNGNNKCSKTNGLCIKGLYVKIHKPRPDGLVATAIFDIDILTSCYL